MIDTVLSNQFRKNVLLFVVFITGGCILVIEVLATRVLSPYFGNTIYTFSSVISIVLAALSIGYAIGGRLADRLPRYDIFYGIIAVSGISVFIIASIAIFLLPLWAYEVSLSTGPLISSIILFTAPSFLLGLLSPYAVKLQSERSKKQQIGTIAGSIFFWSTFGSISGSLAAGFLLIPHIGVKETLVATAFVLLTLGLAGLQRHWKKERLTLWLLTMISAVVAIFVSLLLFFKSTPSHVLYEHDGVYERLRVVDLTIEGEEVRILMQNSNAASMLYLDRPVNYLPTNYYGAYYRLAHHFTSSVENILVLGAGAFVLPRSLLLDFPSADIDAVDIEEELLTIAQDYFGLKANQRLQPIFADGRRFLRDTDKSYDLILLDAFSSMFSIPMHMTTREFFQLLRSKLAPNGLVVADVIGTIDPRYPSLYFSQLRTFQSVFANSAFFATSDPNTQEIQNTVFLGWNGQQQVDFCSPEFSTSEQPLLPTLCPQMISLKNIDLNIYPILTDNFAPVDYLAMKMINNL